VTPRTGGAGRVFEIRSNWQSQGLAYFFRVAIDGECLGSADSNRAMAAWACYAVRRSDLASAPDRCFASFFISHFCSVKVCLNADKISGGKRRIQDERSAVMMPCSMA
jgi:hypothetical protein